MTTHVVSILLAIVGVAIIAVLVSNQAQTGSLLGSAGKSFAGALGCALSPVTGKGCGTSVSSKISFG